MTVAVCLLYVTRAADKAGIAPNIGISGKLQAPSSYLVCRKKVEEGLESIVSPWADANNAEEGGLFNFDGGEVFSAEAAAPTGTEDECERPRQARFRATSS